MIPIEHLQLVRVKEKASEQCARHEIHATMELRVVRLINAMITQIRLAAMFEDALENQED